MINPDDFVKPSHKAKGTKSGGPVHINIRLHTTTRTGPPTAVDVRRVLKLILQTGVVPDGWKLATIDWKNPAKASRWWTTGRVPEEDFENLGAVIRDALWESRISIVRPTPKAVLQGAPNAAERS